jgi:uncharacterized protein involved in oxidation of intracellular sulfur
MRKITLVVHEGPYSSERAFNAVRLAGALLERHSGEAEVRLFLLSDAVYAAMQSQVRPEGSYCLEDMLAAAAARGAKVRACGSCMEHRGLFGVPMLPCVEVSTMADLSDWIVESDQVVSF